MDTPTQPTLNNWLHSFHSFWILCKGCSLTEQNIGLGQKVQDLLDSLVLAMQHAAGPGYWWWTLLLECYILLHTS